MPDPPHPDGQGPTQSVIGATARVFALRLLLAGLIFATDVVIARALGPDGKGAFVILILTPVALASVAGMGLEYALNQHGHARRRGLDGLFESTALLALAGVAVVAAVVYTGALGLRALVYRGYGHLPPGMLAASIALLTCEVMFALVAMYAMTSGRPVGYGWMRIIRRSPVLLAGLSLLVWKPGVSGTSGSIALLVWATVAGIVAASLFGLAIGGFRFRTPADHLRPVLATAASAYPGRVAERLQSRVDTILLGVVGSAHIVGLYSVAVGLAEALYFVSGSLGSVLFSRGVRAGAEETEHARAGRILLPISTVLALAVASAATVLLPLLYGTRFSGSLHLLWLLLPGTVAFSIVHTFTPGMLQLGLARAISVAQASGLALEVAVCVVLIPVLGGFGAALASTSSYLLTLSIMTALYARRLGIPTSSLLVVRSWELRWLRSKVSTWFG